MRWIIRQINRLACRWLGRYYGDVAYMLGDGPCERCVGRLIVSGLPTKIDLQTSEVKEYVEVRHV